MCVEAEHEVVSEAKCTYLSLLNTEESFTPMKKLDVSFYVSDCLTTKLL